MLVSKKYQSKFVNRIALNNLNATTKNNALVITNPRGYKYSAHIKPAAKGGFDVVLFSHNKQNQVVKVRNSFAVNIPFYQAVNLVIQKLNRTNTVVKKAA